MRTEVAHAGRARRAAAVGALAALAVAGGYSLAGIPNVEIMTLIVFASGWLAGSGGGAAAGAIAMFTYTMANPYGTAVPLLAGTQIACFGLIGASGGVWARLTAWRGISIAPLFLGLFGALVTFLYDLATNVAIGISFSQVVPTLVAGVPFSIIHILANALLFAIGGPYLLKGLAAAGFAPAGREVL